MFGLAYGNNTARTSCTSQPQNSRQTFSSFKQILKERGGFSFTTLQQERQRTVRTVWTHDTEYRILYDAASQPWSNAEGTQLQNMLPVVPRREYFILFYSISF